MTGSELIAGGMACLLLAFWILAVQIAIHRRLENRPYATGVFQGSAMTLLVMSSVLVWARMILHFPP